MVGTPPDAFASGGFAHPTNSSPRDREPRRLFKQSANRLSLRLRQPLGDAMDDDKSMLQTATDAVSGAASATTAAAKTAVKNVKKAANRYAKNVTPKKANKAKKAAKKSSAKKSKE